MKMNGFKANKMRRKQKRCEASLLKECNAEISRSPTKVIAVLNAGLTTGLTEETLLCVASSHGNITNITMCRKSFSFLICESTLDAEKIFEALHGKACIGQNGAVIFMTYLKEMPVLKTTANLSSNQLDVPTGLFVIENFVNADEEAALLKSLQAQHPELNSGNLKHRRVQHFGYEFKYDSNNVDWNQPLESKIPKACDILWPRLEAAARGFGIDLPEKLPDQLTVNEYLPGQGIPQHVDTHSAFLEPIISLSLQDEVVMDFRRAEEHVSVKLPRFSLLIMCGETRYDWTHSITPRFVDICYSPSGFLVPRKRSKRTSFTFRYLRRGLCYCSFPTYCDTQLQQSSGTKSPNEEIATALEEKNVHSIYEEIAKHFSETRHSPWPKVAAFLNELPEGSVVADVGCGNAKYHNVNKNLFMLGCDRSQALLSVCVLNAKNVFKCDCLQLPIRSDSMDACISIAVIHHLSTEKRRLQAIHEMCRILRKGGKGLIYVWAKEQHSNAGKSSYLLQNKAVSKRKVTAEQQRQMQQAQLSPPPELKNLTVHTNRTNFLQQDVLVPWKLKSTNISSDQQTYLRYYHVFKDEELQSLLAQVRDLELRSYYYDQGNHCAIFVKK